jgi:threonine dehydrogenase-like Zn-dependent dehydrogenase
MKGTMIYGARDIRFEDRPAPTIIQPTDAILRLSATCICGSDLWPYRGIAKTAQPTPMGHEYCGIVEEVGRGGQEHQAWPVRCRIVCNLGQQLRYLPGRLSVLVRPTRVHERRAGQSVASSSC